MRTSFGWEGKSMFGSFHSWINAWVAGKAVWSLEMRDIPDHFYGELPSRRSAISSVHYVCQLWTLQCWCMLYNCPHSATLWTVPSLTLQFQFQFFDTAIYDYKYRTQGKFSDFREYPEATKLSTSGGHRPLTPWPRALTFDPAGGPRYRFTPRLPWILTPFFLTLHDPCRPLTWMQQKLLHN